MTATFFAATSGGFSVFRFAVTSAARLFTAVMRCIDGRPSAAFRLFVGHASLLVTLFYVLGLPLLFVRVFTLVASWHFFRTSSLVLRVRHRCCWPRRTTRE